MVFSNLFLWDSLICRIILLDEGGLSSHRILNQKLKPRPRKKTEVHAGACDVFESIAVCLAKRD